jgi:hypothetical protein
MLSLISESKSVGFGSYAHRQSIRKDCIGSKQIDLGGVYVTRLEA